MSILRAREEGATFGAIAAAAGTSSQAVQEIVRRHGPLLRESESAESAPDPSLTKASVAPAAE
ncbi:MULTISPECIES: hypothetical protein [Brevibacterium]|uniref:hypothetical protein n=1 Tax=Brevibacterium TaxID=1696 RepID=UPI000DEB19A9|nr:MULTISPECIES: hypothetical protein [Brevibacterium]